MKNVRIAGIEIRLDELKNAGPHFWSIIGALTIMILLGAFAWFFQLPISRGLVVTGMRDVFAWGYYIQNFMYFVGLSAGGLVIYSSVQLFAAKQFRPISRLAVLQAAICVFVAALFILVDLGNPQRVFWFLLSPNFRSVFIYDATILNLYLILCVVDAWVLMSERGGERLELVMTLISLPAAVGLHSITAWILGLQKARELWNTALMAPIFLSSAMVSGIALLILICLAVNRLTDIKFERKMFNSLAKLLATILTIDLFFLFSEVLTGIWPSSASPGHLARLGLILTGKYSPLFLSEIFLFGVLPFFLLAIPRTRKSTGIQILACSFILVGVFIKRFMFIVMGFALSPIGPVKSSYVPTLVELLVGTGVWAVGALVFILAVKLLPVRVPVEHHSAEKAA